MIITEDDVYLESAAEREEYVLNKTGLIFRGTSKNPTPLHWNFAQVSNSLCMCVFVSMCMYMCGCMNSIIV